jgi:hypothetical protein
MTVGAAAAAGFTEREGGQLEIRGRNELGENSRPGVRAAGATLASVVMVAGAFFDAGAVIAAGVVEGGVEVEAKADGAIGADATTRVTEAGVTALCFTSSDTSDLPISVLEATLAQWSTTD